MSLHHLPGERSEGLEHSTPTYSSLVSMLVQRRQGWLFDASYLYYHATVTIDTRSIFPTWSVLEYLFEDDPLPAVLAVWHIAME